MTCPKVKLFSRSKFQMGLCVTNRDNYLEKTEAESEHLSLHSIYIRTVSSLCLLVFVLLNQ